MPKNYKQHFANFVTNSFKCKGISSVSREKFIDMLCDAASNREYNMDQMLEHACSQQLNIDIDKQLQQ